MLFALVLFYAELSSAFANCVVEVLGGGSSPAQLMGGVKQAAGNWGTSRPSPFIRPRLSPVYPDPPIPLSPVPAYPAQEGIDKIRPCCGAPNFAPSRFRRDLEHAVLLPENQNRRRCTRLSLCCIRPLASFSTYSVFPIVAILDVTGARGNQPTLQFTARLTPRPFKTNSEFLGGTTEVVTFPKRSRGGE